MLLEVCVDSYESAKIAAEHGADRLELCANLLIGGTSPSPFLIEAVQALGVPVRVLLRPRFGDFLYTPMELELLRREVESCRSLGVDGVVLGVLTADGRLDREALSMLLDATGPLHKTLHRAFDVCRDPFEGLEDAVALGFNTILTSGQRATAVEGADLLRQLHAAASGRITLMAGSGVNLQTLPRLLAETPLDTFHLSAKTTVDSPMVFRREGVPMGLPMAGEYDRFYADGAVIAQVKALLCRSFP